MTPIFNNPDSPFYNTYKLYRDYIGYKKPLSYNRWMRLDDKYKAAALFVQFYNEITLAWVKLKTDWAIEEEAVETINQYLIKNVEKIKQDKKRFNPRYIYTVSKNCLYCICLDETKNKARHYNEYSESFQYGDDELSAFDVYSQDDVESEVFKGTSYIDTLPQTHQIAIQLLLGEITDSAAIRALKKMGKCDVKVNNREEREAFLENFVNSFKVDFLNRLQAANQLLSVA